MAISTHCMFHRGTSPIVAAAIHNGHDTREDVAHHLAIDEQAQLREEDPMTGEWSQVAKTQIVGLRSRFEVDLNRPRTKAVYVTPAEAWGMNIWRTPPDEHMIQESLREYDQFYTDVHQLLNELVHEFGKVVVYDLHTYNHRRGGPFSPPADLRSNPEVNVGTGTMDRRYWSPVVDRFVGDLKKFDFHGRHLDVRENVKFQGGYFGEWIHTQFPKQVCSIAIEFKKVFMDEWTGEENPREVESIYRALRSTLPGVRRALEEM